MKRAISGEEVIALTAEVVHNFYGRNMADAVEKMDDSFMFIGGQDFQWAESKAAFLRMSAKEAVEPPVLISDEEFHVLLREKNICVVYGRYHLTSTLNDGTLLHAHARGTYVWKTIDDKLRLVHIHGSHAQDIPLHPSQHALQPLNEKSSLLLAMKDFAMSQYDEEKLQFRDRMNHYHFVHPMDVLYLQADRQWSTVCTSTGKFQIRGVLKATGECLPSCFMRIHKSYVVNLRQMKSVSRYTALLWDGQVLPVSKDKYQALKQALAAQTNAVSTY